MVIVFAMPSIGRVNFLPNRSDFIFYVCIASEFGIFAHICIIYFVFILDLFRSWCLNMMTAIYPHLTVQIRHELLIVVIHSVISRRDWLYLDDAPLLVYASLSFIILSVFFEGIGKPIRILIHLTSICVWFFLFCFVLFCLWFFWWIGTGAVFYVYWITFLKHLYFFEFVPLFLGAFLFLIIYMFTDTVFVYVFF